MNERTQSLDELYFNWLVSQVGSVSNPNPARTYYQLLEQMHLKRFDWFIPNDDNRLEDGKELRYEFMNGPSEDETWCSFLEMLIALSRRAAFQSYSDPIEWFWHLVENLDLRHFSDENFMELESRQIRHTLDVVVSREYAADGQGGLFPLKNPPKDQREVELWYQMAGYLLEGNGP